MKQIAGIATALALIFCLVCAPMMAMAGTMDEGENYETEVTCGWTETTPTIDGVIDVNEWIDAVEIDIAYEVENYTVFQNESVYLYFMNDADWFYFAIDLPIYIDEDAGFSGGIMIDENNDKDWTYGDEDEFNELMFGIFGNATMSMAMSLKGGVGAIGFGESATYDDEDHYMAEFAFPFIIMNDGDMVMGDSLRFAMFVEPSDSDYWENVTYPIDVESGLMDEPPIDSGDWAEITLATGEIEQEASIYEYSVIMIIAGLIVFIVLLVFHKETIFRWIADGKDKWLFGAMILGILLVALGLLQHLYDWLGMLGLYDWLGMLGL